eukprot:gene12316-5990_t
MKESIKQLQEAVKLLTKKIPNKSLNENVLNLLEPPPEMKRVPSLYTLNLDLRESDKWWRKSRPNTKNEYLLILAIPTIARIGKNGQLMEYLAKTCLSLLHNIKNYYRFEKDSKHKILVYVQSVNPQKEHLVFEKLRRDVRFSKYFVFDKLKKRKLEPHEDIRGHNYAAPNNAVPGKTARQQSFDVINLTKKIKKKYKTDYIMFMEDDFLACQKSIIETIRSIAVLELRRDKELCSFSVSYGMNGILMRMKMASKFIEFAERDIQQLPIDNLYNRFVNDAPRNDFEKGLFCRSNGRRLFTHRFILFEHIGDHSTFLERNKPNFRPRFKTCGDVSSAYLSGCRSNPESISPC